MNMKEREGVTIKDLKVVWQSENNIEISSDNLFLYTILKKEIDNL